ncbi:MAG: zinc ribbon domain-containing protein [Clostridia bacterium]|nr:zinc ribbon domain-containing protein [Clostridia bacterium]
MICKKCGSEIDDGAKFCSNCGAPAETPTEMTAPEAEVVTETEEKLAPVTDGAEETPKEKPKRKRKKPTAEPVEVEKISDSITLYSDGKYRWKYEMSLVKNPTIFFTVWKIFFFIILAGFVIGFFVSLGKRDFFWSGFLGMLGGYGIALGVMTVLTALACLLYAAIIGKYSVEFEMDENGVLHTQNPAQHKKAKKLGAATMIAGAASGRPSIAMAGRMSTAKTCSYSDFSRVRRVKASKLFSTIKVNELLEHNQVYAEKEDFEFVKNYIIEHCENLKGKKK